MSVIQELYQITEALYREVQKQESKDNREEQIERINKLLEDRQNLLDMRLQPPFNEEENKLGQRMVQLNQVIDSQLQKILADIKMDIKELKVKKAKSTMYSNPYESLSMDGMFFDKRN
ncbi:Flagellar protein FliT [Schinkia azotoformans MEV2011]|uniref:Flagellar protein FliT n=1 Tax=Schinkia azotoformans MEV2011 TaxID=1348973 RepID=A0A072P4A2_SCHAZ|nr:flagellar protein FliT [Schinkia azotoformans]KEF40305.1 Flagellar protein FliT [Schinkia azotoformans MEV2011]MEC1696387.1 flagellar protein FliT [Schinkia azotoformans]MEC1715557.1 flagellar protein FliT [Schinkia azotoformans]MEC1724059.1 flagellar protein FliT [Schinkia azotoformans]MEC1743443.1 flagellar protein FliT [Schinkia azotoformans]